ncbi:EcoKI restriction-modification system protein HsdS [Phocoenobacter uteri]|uniref:EcoKI restriction-modification system protein HsdS n=1 Tax=Phocoenobacter uteri TaxID=146806 RepID=A0A379C6Z5_9PAST|nr:restriction endonuclease subunit S [Phocoenobacter uteri]MDG6882003.1 hypothetical protein [Phocoenobacter uteri]SUB58152.1 EcoKI restriction-modification system protein HsdS [Phocoenobacter uteri]
MSNWETKNLFDVIDIIGGGTPKRSNSEYWNGNINWLSVADFNNNSRFISSSAETITELGLVKSSTKLLKKGQLIISARGTVGCIAQLSKEMAFNQSCYGLNGKDGIIDNGFLYYSLKNSIAELKQKTHGAVFDTITRETFKNIKITYPSLRTQIDIANKLGFLDKKIQLNTKTNQTLENIAQAIFKSWFIDFDPVHTKANALANGDDIQTANRKAMMTLSGKTDTELTEMAQQSPTEYAQLHQTAQAFPSEFGENGLPLGWEMKPSDSLFDIAIGKTPPRKEQEWFSNNKNDVQWISIKDMGNSGTFIFNSSEYLTHTAVDKFNVRRIPTNTVLLSFKLTVGRVVITTCETTTNEAIAHFKLNNKKSILTSEFLYCYLKSFDFNNLGSTSSIATAVNSKTIKSMPILNVPQGVLLEFQNKILSIFEQIKNNQIEINSLIEIRDTLLPKLLNGEL